MSYPTTSKEVLLKRLGGTPGKGTSAGLTGKGGVDVIVPPMPQFPRHPTPKAIQAYNDEIARWHENFSAQFPAVTKTT